MSMLTKWLKHEWHLPEDTPGEQVIGEGLEKLGQQLEAHAADVVLWADRLIPLPEPFESMDGPAIALVLNGLAKWLKTMGADHNGDG